MSAIILDHKISDDMILSLIENSKKDVVLNDRMSKVVENIRQYQKLGITVAALRDSKTLGIGGVGRIHTGVGVAWIIINYEFLKYPKSLLKVARYIIKEAKDTLDLHRIQMDIDTTFEENARFAKRLGFSFEGPMIKYGPEGQDYHRYTLIRKD